MYNLLSELVKKAISSLKITENDMIDYYEILEVSPNASEEVIRKAYHALIQKYHPDHFNSSYKEFATRQTRTINDAYRLLSDPDERHRYDLRLAERTKIAQEPPLSLLRRFIQPVLRILLITVLAIISLRFLGVILKTIFISPLLKVIIPLLFILFLVWFFKKSGRKIR